MFKNTPFYKVCDSITLSSASASTSDSSSCDDGCSPSPPSSQQQQQRKAHLLCDQLNQILNISTITMQRSESTANMNQRKPEPGTIAKSKSRTQIMSRSHTFHSNKCGEKTNEDVEYSNEFLLDSEPSQNTESKQNILANYVLRNGKRLLAWNRKQSQDHQTCEQETTVVKSGLLVSRSRDDQMTNLIAAKLLSESIELNKLPYSDEVN